MIKKNKKAFTLVEVLIALSISAFIILAMTQLYRNLMGFIEGSREIIVLDRKVCLLFNQLSADISSSFIPFEQSEEIKSEEKKEGEKQGEEKRKEEPKQEKPKKDEKDKQKDQKFFYGEIYEDEYRRIDGKKWELFKSLNFITTNPLQVYKEKKSRKVRIKYQLEKDKNKSTGEKTVYKLFRKETVDISNIDFKTREDVKKSEIKKFAIYSYLVADDIKDFYVEYSTTIQSKNKENTVISRQSNKEEEEKKFFVWNKDIIVKLFGVPKVEGKTEEESKKTVNYYVPRQVEVTVVFWDEKLLGQHSFNLLIPILSFPTLLTKDDKKTETPQSQQPATPSLQTPTVGQPIPPPPTDFPTLSVPGQPAGQPATSGAPL